MRPFVRHRTPVAAAAVLVGVLAALAGPLPVPALLPTASAEPLPSTKPLNGWDVNGVVYATKIVGSTVYVGGRFTQVRSPSGATQTRTNLAAISLGTGAVLPFRADTNGVVRALEGDATSNTVWVGGSYTSIGGAARYRLAALDATSGAVRTTFSANTTSTVYALEKSGSVLYVGGAFSTIRNIAQTRLAAVEAATGVVRTAFKPAPNGTVQAIVASPAGDRVYAGGSFTAIGGATRSFVSGVLSTTGAATGPVFANLTGRAIGLDVSTDGATLFGALGDNANRVTAWNSATGSQRWRQRADGDVQAVRYRDGTVYFGFHEGFAGDLTVRLLAANATTGALTTFRPAVNSFYGVWALDATASALVAGGEFTWVAQVPTQGVAIFRVT